MAQDIQTPEEQIKPVGQPATPQEPTEAQNTMPEGTSEDTTEDKAKATKKGAKNAPKKSTPEEDADAPNEEDAAGEAGDGTADDKEPLEEAEEDATTALEKLAREIMEENSMDVIFATTDGTLFGYYTDARNHARNIKDETVCYFTRPGLSTEELQKLVPSSLLHPEAEQQETK
ncbi:hypothetical protein [Porphyromonas catoniae]|uniref:Uncharacterized protein n=1 Tax=Porphyromonas catoniae ATCC 51270 TaxID=887901 RepID=Z4WZN3_9PORP|nr:hypothetical protein [Porphyromonas catoniae]EWC93220.1 hypothetical protein HMPREF0636_1087 [Porphyromonas catoniae ATCC 51270]DAV05713.1 MAG TPA: hypothetical protein [Caudoviricetes sp.]